MALIDTTWGLRRPYQRARQLRFEPGENGSVATNVQDAIDELRAALAGFVAPDLSGYMLLAGHQTTTGGFGVTVFNIGTITSGTVTPDPNNGNYQFLTNNGAFTLAAPTVDCALDILVINGASAGAITLSGFTVGSSVGDPLTTINSNKFLISTRRMNGTSTYVIKALQ